MQVFERDWLHLEVHMKLCGMCNSYPDGWAAPTFVCRRNGNTIHRTSESCDKFTDRDPDKSDVPLFSTMSERRIELRRLARQQLDRAVAFEFDKVDGMPRSQPPQFDRRRQGFIYFVQVLDMIKIGYTSDVSSRLASFMTVIPQPIELIGLLSGGLDDEKQMHRHFDTYRVASEWFQATPEMKQEVRRVCGPRRWKKLLPPGIKSTTFERRVTDWSSD